MRIVLDSNVYISAALSVEGNSRSILKLAERGLVEVSISDSITTEIERILKEKLQWPAAKADLWIIYLRSLTDRVDPQEQVDDCSDPDDNHVLECALQAQAEVIVTGDGHLLELNPYRGIKILKPKDFLESGI
jgi:putative PIN family toxin of toxin-antitoxin system